MLAPHRAGSGGIPWGVISQPGDRLRVPIDPNGNLTQKTDSTGTWTYTWNAENQLVRVTKDGADVATFAYDAMGRRVERVAGGLATSYAYDAEDILRKTRGTTAYGYAHGPAVDEPLAREDSSGAPAYYHADGLGSILGMTDEAGNVLDPRQYDAWGKLQLGAEEAGPAFTGREWDTETGLYYYRARYYDPAAGRFVTEDPIGTRGGIGLYTYVDSTPTNEIDPSGTSPAVALAYRFLHLLKYPPKPPLKCFVYCIPSVYLDDLVTLTFGAGISRLPWPICKKIGGGVMKKVVPALGVLNLPTYIGCLFVCEEAQRRPEPCPPKRGGDEPPPRCGGSGGDS